MFVDRGQTFIIYLIINYYFALINLRTLINDFNKNELIFYNQNEDDASYCKRRTKNQSEITIEEIQTKSSKYLYDKVRSLQDPYPNAYITCADGVRLYITEAKLEEN